MNKADAKKRLLGFCVQMMTGDDEVCFGPIAEEPESQEFKALDAARRELVGEFNKRSRGLLPHTPVRAVNKADAKKRLLGFCVQMMTGDDEACFGPIAEEPESQEFKALDAARRELVGEFNKRGAT